MCYRDPPIEKAESAQNHTIPEIQINGPSNSPSKENGLTSSPNQHTTPSSKEFSPDSTQQNGIEDHPSETGEVTSSFGVHDSFVTILLDESFKSRIRSVKIIYEVH